MVAILRPSSASPPAATRPTDVADRPTANPSPLWDAYKQRYRGVSEITRDRWRAVIRIDGMRHHLGTAPTAREAAAITAGYLLARFGPDWPTVHAAHVRAARRFSAARRHRRTVPTPDRPDNPSPKLPAGAG